MMDVTPSISLVAHGDLWRMEAHVTAPSPRPLRWTLIVESRSVGGASSVTQGGSTDGRSPGALGSVSVQRDANGSAKLVVRDASGASVAEKSCRFGSSGAEIGASALDCG